VRSSEIELKAIVSEQVNVLRVMVFRIQKELR